MTKREELELHLSQQYCNYEKGTYLDWEYTLMEGIEQSIRYIEKELKELD